MWNLRREVIRANHRAETARTELAQSWKQRLISKGGGAAAAPAAAAAVAVADRELHYEDEPWARAGPARLAGPDQTGGPVAVNDSWEAWDGHDSCSDCCARRRGGLKRFLRSPQAPPPLQRRLAALTGNRVHAREVDTVEINWCTVLFVQVDRPVQNLSACRVYESGDEDGFWHFLSKIVTWFVMKVCSCGKSANETPSGHERCCINAVWAAVTASRYFSANILIFQSCQWTFASTALTFRSLSCNDSRRVSEFCRRQTEGNIYAMQQVSSAFAFFRRAINAQYDFAITVADLFSISAHLLRFSRRLRCSLPEFDLDLGFDRALAIQIWNQKTISVNRPHTAIKWNQRTLTFDWTHAVIKWNQRTVSVDRVPTVIK